MQVQTIYEDVEAVIFELSGCIVSVNHQHNHCYCQCLQQLKQKRALEEVGPKIEATSLKVVTIVEALTRLSLPTPPYLQTPLVDSFNKERYPRYMEEMLQTSRLLIG